jgi:hypothetical protein
VAADLSPTKVQSLELKDALAPYRRDCSLVGEDAPLLKG